MKLNRQALEDFKEGIELYDKISFIEELLKHYNLIEKDSVAFQNKLLDFSHLDIELEEGDYSTRVSIWMDFITTLCVMFGAEPLVLTAEGGVPNLRHTLRTIQGVNIEICSCCKGRGEVVSKTDYQFYKCAPCLGIGFMLPEVSLKFS